MRANAILNIFLERTLGVNLKRVNTRKIKKAQKEPFYVEFAGVPGVGKSTLYKNVFSRVNNSWLEIHELEKIFAHHTSGIPAESVLCYQELAQHKMNAVASYDYNGMDKMKIVKYFHYVLIQDSLVYLFNKHYNIMSDEGLIHNFGKNIIAQATRESMNYEKLLKQRAIIYCYAPAEIIAKRIIARKKITGNILPQHKVDSFEELIKLQEKALNNYHETIDFSQKYNIPVLSIDTSDSMQQNVAKVKDFITKLTDRK